MTENVSADTAVALDRMTGGDPGLAAAAMLYATAFAESPEAVVGMLCVTQGILLERIADLHGVLMQVKPYLDDPALINNALLDNLPPAFRAMLGV